MTSQSPLTPEMRAKLIRDAASQILQEADPPVSQPPPELIAYLDSVVSQLADQIQTFNAYPGPAKMQKELRDLAKQMVRLRGELNGSLGIFLRHRATDAPINQEIYRADGALEILAEAANSVAADLDKEKRGRGLSLPIRDGGDRSPRHACARFVLRAWAAFHAQTGNRPRLPGPAERPARHAAEYLFLAAGGSLQSSIETNSRAWESDFRDVLGRFADWELAEAAGFMRSAACK